MWTFVQLTGELRDPNNKIVGMGYSGHGAGRNNPDMETIHNVGPIPAGLWKIGKPFSSSKHGPFCLEITPLPETETHGRSGFLMHGDAQEHPGEASLGCIVQSRAVRELVAKSGDDLLEVVHEPGLTIMDPELTI